MSFASKPMARILLSCSETDTTEARLNYPLARQNTRVLAVPKSMPNLREKNPMWVIYPHTYFLSRKNEIGVGV